MKKNNDISIARVATVPFAIVTQLKSQLQFLVDSGAEVHVVTSDGPELMQMEWSSKLFLHKIQIARRPSLVADIVSLFRLFFMFRESRFHIVHSTTPKAGLLTALAAYCSGVPVRLHTFTGQQWVEMHGVLRWVSRISDKLIASLNTRCYADSVSQVKFLVDEGIVDSGKIGVIGSGSLAGVDCNRFCSDVFIKDDKDKVREELGIGESSFVVIFIGRITKDKGIRELLSAFNLLRNSSADVELLLVGPLDQNCGGKGTFSFSDIDDIEGVHCVGYSDVPEKYLAIADVLCLPSHREGFGTVVLEAASMGVPAVGTDIYGLRDAIVHGSTGILVPVRDVPSLFKALSFLENDRDLRIKMGVAAKNRCIQEFSADAISLKLLEEYRDLLKLG